ncbi:MAG: hypothetical protein ACLQU2_05800 [Candidatus Binataceae bacterium]
MALVILLAVAVAFPLSSYAQSSNAQDQPSWQLRDPNEYQQEDSHPVRAIGSLLSPVGWALEWGIARPWHYVATQTFLAPVLNGGQDEDSWDEYYDSGSMAQVPITAPAGVAPGPTSQQAFREQNIAPPAASSQATTTTTTRTYQVSPGAPPAPAAASPGQATLH